MKFFIGCSGWQYDDWQGRFYPDGTKKEWLKFYSSVFNTVEVNSSFYHLPKPETIKNWKNNTPSKFVFSLKASRWITHMKKFNDEGAVRTFYSICDNMDKKLGCILFQLPPILKKNMSLLEKINSQLDRKKQNVIEFRHESWYDEEVYKFMKKKRIGFCTVSSRQMPDDIVITGKILYIRFHGPGALYASNYEEKEMKKWALRIKEAIRKEKPKYVYAYFNNDVLAYAPKNALMLKNFLEQK